jgi:hypothetical protein
MSDPSPQRVAPTLTIQHFPKSQEGQMLIAEQKPFILGGQIYQGYKETVANVHEKQCTDAEIEAMYDVDGTKGNVLTVRKQRLAGRAEARRKELAEREAEKRLRKKEELELAKLEREEAERTAAVNLPAAVVPGQPSPAPVGCQLCGALPPDGKTLEEWVPGHMLGKHARRRKKKVIKDDDQRPA